LSANICSARLVIGASRSTSDVARIFLFDYLGYFGSSLLWAIDSCPRESRRAIVAGRAAARCEIVKAKASQCRVKKFSFHLASLLAIVPLERGEYPLIIVPAIWRRGA